MIFIIGLFKILTLYNYLVKVSYANYPFGAINLYFPSKALPKVFIKEDFPAPTIPINNILKGPIRLS